MKKSGGNKGRRFDKQSIIGLILLIISFSMGALLRNSTYLVNGERIRLVTCDDYIASVCIPTAYLSITLPMLGDFIINVTSFSISLVLFVAGVILVRR